MLDSLVRTFKSVGLPTETRSETAISQVRTQVREVLLEQVAPLLKPSRQLRAETRKAPVSRESS